MTPLESVAMLKALDGLSVRQAAIAQNLANANSPGYRPIRVSFEQALASAASTGRADAVSAVRPRVTTALPTSGDGGVRLDLELAGAASTALRYSAVVDVLSRELQLSHLAITGSE